MLLSLQWFRLVARESVGPYHHRLQSPFYFISTFFFICLQSPCREKSVLLWSDRDMIVECYYIIYIYIVDTKHLFHFFSYICFCFMTTSNLKSCCLESCRVLFKEKSLMERRRKNTKIYILCFHLYSKGTTHIYYVRV